MTKELRILQNRIIKDKAYMKLRFVRTNERLYKDRLFFLSKMEEYISNWHHERTA